MALGDARYVAFTTFRRSGEPVPTPVWIAELPDGSLGFTTGSTLGKAKRLRHTARVLVQPCDARGRVKAGTEAVSGTAELFTEGPRVPQVRRAILKKYGWQMRLIGLATAVRSRLLRTGRPPSDAVVVVTLD